MKNNNRKPTIETKHSRINSDRYLITYADLLTLLFALFVILYSISKPDNEKMQEILEAMNNVFSPNQIIEGNRLSPDVSSQDKPPVILFPIQPLTVPEIQEQIEKKLVKLVDNNTIAFEEMPNGIKIAIPNKFLFESAKATVLEDSYEILNDIAAAIADLDMQILVDGHTDAVPIKSFMYASNWELSAARAVNIVQAFIKQGVPPTNLVVRAFGEQRPAASNLEDAGREKNRRVEIIIEAKDAASAASKG